MLSRRKFLAALGLAPVAAPVLAATATAAPPLRRYGGGVVGRRIGDQVVYGEIAGETVLPNETLWAMQENIRADLEAIAAEGSDALRRAAEAAYAPVSGPPFTELTLDHPTFTRPVVIRSSDPGGIDIAVS